MKARAVRRSECTQATGEEEAEAHEKDDKAEGVYREVGGADRIRIRTSPNNKERLEPAA